MKKKAATTIKTPRYITIRIQYYPIPQHVIRSFIFFVFCLSVISGVTYFKDTITIDTADHGRKTIVHDSSFKILQLLTAVKKIKTTTIAHAAANILPDKVVFHGIAKRKEIALTFDADMTPGMKNFLDSGTVVSYYDKNVTDILTSTQTKATLFLAGMWIEVYPEAARELAANPLFELASHSYSHPSFSGDCYGLGEIPDSEDDEQFEKTQVLLQNITGKKNTLFRFPGGCYSQTDVESAKKAGLTVIQWDVAGRDGFNEDTASIENNVIPSIKDGSIIVLHMSGYPNAPKTAEALPTIITNLKEQGYTFVTVSELLASPPSDVVKLTGALITP